MHDLALPDEVAAVAERMFKNIGNESPSPPLAEQSICRLVRCDVFSIRSCLFRYHV